MAFDLNDYEPVATRLARFLTDCTTKSLEPRIITHLHHYDEKRCVFRAEIYVNDPATGREMLVATGWEEETRGEGMVNRTSHLANCETGSIGRALANYGYAGSDPSKRASREEMSKVARTQAPAPRPAVRPSGEPIEEPFSGGHQMEAASRPSGDASPKQLGLLRALARDRGIAAGKGVVDAVQAAVGRSLMKLDDLTKQEASRVIEAWKAEAPTLDEEPF
jgi:hypothetical protein